MQSTQGSELSFVFMLTGSLSTLEILPPPGHQTEGKVKAYLYLCLGVGLGEYLHRWTWLLTLEKLSCIITHGYFPQRPVCKGLVAAHTPVGR